MRRLLLRRLHPRSGAHVCCYDRDVARPSSNHDHGASRWGLSLVARGLLFLAVTSAIPSCSRKGVATVSDTKTEDDLAGEGHAATPPPDASLPPLPSAADASASEEGPFYEPEPHGRPTVILRGDAPNIHYAALDKTTCLAELDRRKIKTEAAPATAGVTTPLWLRGPLHGIAIHSQLAPAQREHSSVEIFDCRLLVALDDFTSLLAKHDIVEMVHMSAYRPRSAYGCTPKYAGKQHCAALAVDVGSFRRRDGKVLEVLRDFHGKINLATCTQSAKPSPPSPFADELWSYVCDAARQAIFHVILTPNFNLQHKNHFHLEITPEAGWMLIH